MNIDEIPDQTPLKYPHRITVAVSAESLKKLAYLKNKRGKKTSAFLREVIEEKLTQIEIED